MRWFFTILLLFSSTQLKAEVLPRQDSKSEWMTDHIRSYYTTTESGEKRLVLTNLDESGKRMGPPVKIETAKAPNYEIASAPNYFRQETPGYIEDYEYPEYQRMRHSYERPYFDPYLFGAWIPDYPGSSFGFHLFPQFFVVRPQRTPGFWRPLR
jgi:hypothetical protein